MLHSLYIATKGNIAGSSEMKVYHAYLYTNVLIAQPVKPSFIIFGERSEPTYAYSWRGISIYMYVSDDAFWSHV